MQDLDNFSVDTDTLDAIREVNLSYLVLAQHLLQKNFAQGMFRLGLDEDVAQILLTLSPAQTIKIASTGSLLCSFRLNDAHLLRALRLDDKDVPAARAAQNLHHVAILLAQRTANGEVIHTPATAAA